MDVVLCCAGTDEAAGHARGGKGHFLDSEPGGIVPVIGVFVKKGSFSFFVFSCRVRCWLGDSEGCLDCRCLDWDLGIVKMDRIV